MLDEALTGWVTALGLGVMIGVVRERHHAAQDIKAGIRTHFLLALLGALGWHLGPQVFVVLLLGVAALTTVGYAMSAREDPGLTGEVAALVTVLLAALAQTVPAMAGALGVVVAFILHEKSLLHRFSREWISEHEVRDVLMLGAGALVIMPLLPTEPLDPWRVLSLTTLWKLVVLVMALGLLGHLAMRAAGPRWGLLVLGLGAGLVSSTVAVASFGKELRERAADPDRAAVGALLANFASMGLTLAVLMVASPSLGAAMLVPLLAGMAALIVVVLALHLRSPDALGSGTLRDGSNVSIRKAIGVALMLGGVLVLSAWAESRWGHQGVWLTALVVGIAELHSAVTSVAQLHHAGLLENHEAARGILAALLASVIAKSALAFATGGVRYGLRICVGLLLMLFTLSFMCAFCYR
jgi:uncharacterized membrane protein (DUF4010 family)